MKIAFGIALGMIALSSQGSPDYVTSGKSIIGNNPNMGPPNGGYPIPPIGGPNIGMPIPPNGGYPIPPIGGPGIGMPIPPNGGYPIPPIGGPGIGMPIPPNGGYPIPPIGGPGIGMPIGPNGGFFPGCKVTGFYRHMCMVATTPDIYDPNTQYDPSYRCLRNAVCKYKGGQCRWVRTQKYKRCMYNLRNEPHPHNNGMF